MREVKYLTFKTRIERTISIYKLRRDNPHVRVLKNGAGVTRCCGKFFSALVELQCVQILSETRRDTEYFNSEKIDTHKEQDGILIPSCPLWPI